MKTQSSSPDLANQPAQPATAEGCEDVLYFKRVVRHLVEIGDEFAELVRQEARQSIHVQAEAAKRYPDPQMAPPLVVPPYIVDAYERLTRSIRRSMVMYQKLCEPPKARPVYNRVAARKKIIREVEDAIQRKASGAQAETLRAELVERLERPEFDDELATRSIGEIVNEICRDLGVCGIGGPAMRRTPDDIAILHARATKVSGQTPSAERGVALNHPDDS